MMGEQQPLESKLFYTGFSLEKRVRSDNPLRKVAAAVDFDFVSDEVRHFYGRNGNVSVPPPVILKLMFLLFFFNVRSERELMARLPEHLDWLWFLGFELDSPIPDHSVLSKARARWGEDLFRSFFERIVVACMDAGLVDGSKIFVDASLVRADASNNSVVDLRSLRRHLRKGYREFESRLESTEGEEGSGGVNARCVSMTDPEAALVSYGGGAKLQYKVHRSVDVRSEVITATDATRGDEHESHLLVPLAEQHRINTGRSAAVVVADSKYGTVENYLSCLDRGIRAHIPDLGRGTSRRREREGFFSESRFRYDPDRDVYICPAGAELKRVGRKASRRGIDYGAAPSICKSCHLRTQCTRSKRRRTIRRHERQADIERMRSEACGAESKRDIRQRQHLMERSFARAVPHGHKRARWRGLQRVLIQEYLISAIQNIKVLIRFGRPKSGAAVEVSPTCHVPALAPCFT